MKNQQKGFANIALIVIIVAVVAVGVYFVFSKKLATPAPSQQSSEINSVNEQNRGQGTSFITEPNKIQIVSPRSGEKLEVGEAYDVRWTNYSGREPLTIALQATTPDNKVSAKIIASNIPATSTGSYKWIVTSENSKNKYKIEVYPAGGRDLVGRSKDFFSITKTIPETPEQCNGGKCESLDMLIFISPQYSRDTNIENAVEDYIVSVKKDIGWNSKIIAVDSTINDFRKIDTIIEKNYSDSGKKLKATIMVGEDMQTASNGDLISHDNVTIERLSTMPWYTLGGTSSYQTKEPGSDYVILPYESKMDILVSVIYPTHSLDYKTKSQQIVSVFNKFSKDRKRVYSNKIEVLFNPLGSVGDPSVADPMRKSIYKSLGNYGELNFKESPGDAEIAKSLGGNYMMYSVSSHGNPYYITLPTLFWADFLNDIDSPLITASGCNAAGWDSYGQVNDKLDYSIIDPNKEGYWGSRIVGKTWFGNNIFENPNLRVIVVGFPDQPGEPGTHNFIINAIPTLVQGKTIAESMIGKIYTKDDAIVMGDPTFHYNLK